MDGRRKRKRETESSYSPFHILNAYRNWELGLSWDWIGTEVGSWEHYLGLPFWAGTLPPRVGTGRELEYELNADTQMWDTGVSIIRLNIHSFSQKFYQIKENLNKFHHIWTCFTFSVINLESNHKTGQISFLWPPPPPLPIHTQMQKYTVKKIMSVRGNEDFKNYKFFGIQKSKIHTSKIKEIYWKQHKIIYNNKFSY